MAYLLIALLGAACGTLLSWYLLIPIVSIVALATGMAGAVKGHSFGEVLIDTALMVSVLEMSWLATVLTAARLIHRGAKSKKRAAQSTDRDHRRSEYEG